MEENVENSTFEITSESHFCLICIFKIESALWETTLETNVGPSTLGSEVLAFNNLVTLELKKGSSVPSLGQIALASRTSSDQ